MAFKSGQTDGMMQPRRASQRKRAEAMQNSLTNKSHRPEGGELGVDRAGDKETIAVDLNDQNNSEHVHIGASISNVGEEHFQCGICLKGFQTMELLSSHIYKHNIIENFQCNICDSIFSTSDALSFHLDEHNNVVRPFKCGICNAGFIENSELLDHVTKSHEAMPSFYKCRVCSFSFQEISKLILHIEEEHSLKFRCGICGKQVSQETELSLHIHTHTEGSPKLSKCPICLSKVPASIMRNHIMIHDKEKGKSIMHNRSHGLTRTRTKKSVVRQQKDPLQKREKRDGIITTKRSENGRKKNYNDNDSDIMEHEGEGTNSENEEVQVKRGGKRKRVGNSNSKLNPPTKVKPTPAIKDTRQLIACMKVDPKNGREVYDCDVCGIRVNNRDFFIQHRDDHFCDGKFCINCQHCSEAFDSFEELDDHIGPGKCSGYNCKTCGRSFSLEPVLLTHQVKQHSSLTKRDGVFTCAICEKTFANKTAYIRHASSHSEDKCIQCKLCRHAFTTQESLLGHLRTTHSVIPLTRKQYKYNCDVCGANFMKDEALSTHQATVHNIESDPSSIIKSNLKKQKTKLPDVKKTIDNDITAVKRTGHWRSAEDDIKRRTCPVCNRVFGRFKDVRRHIGTHTKPYLCSHCGKSFPYRYSLDAHIKAYHSAENPHKCETCNKFFSCERSLTIHRRIHTGEKPHQCHICHRSFRQVANLSMHIKLHSTDKPIKCELCDYRCSHQGYLKRHMSTHSTEKKHMCPICNKGFAEKPNLNHHLKRHSKVKNHVCAVCGHRFAERYYLNNHMRIHTKEKPYSCPVCNRAFTMRPNMVSHIKKTHPSYNYQPIRPSHKQVSDSNPNNITRLSTNKEVSVTNILDTDIQDHSPAKSTLTTTVITASLSANAFTSINSNLVPTTILTPATPHPLTTIAPPLPPLPTPQFQIQLQQSAQPSSNVSISVGNNDLIYQQLTNPPTVVKLDSLRFPQVTPTPRDLLANFQQQQLQQQTEPQQQQQLQPVEHILQETNAQVQENQSVQRGANDVIEQTIHQDLPERLRHPYTHNVNMSDRFISSHFVNSQQQLLPVTVSACQNQNFPAVPIASQSYMYTYPSMPASDNLLPMPVQGFFTNHQIHQNSNPHTS